jgi:hypothetical protein
MARKVLKENGQVVIQSTVCSLTKDEILSENKKAKCITFDTKVHEVLGNAFKPKDFKDDPDMSNIDTPTYEAYQDDDDGIYTVPDINKADPNTFDCYIGAKVELSVGDQVMTSKI